MILKKLLSWLIGRVRPFSQIVLSSELKFVLKLLLPSNFIQNFIRDANANEWYAARKQNPYNIKSKQFESGINIVGYFQVAKGISETARSNLIAFSAAKIPYSVIDYEAAMPFYLKTEILPSTPYLNKFKFNTNLIHINPPQLHHLWGSFEKNDLTGRYTIGVWYWELPDFPDEWLFAFDLVDEVWVASQFVYDSVSAKSPVPVRTIPPCIDVMYDHTMLRSDFNLPSESFLFFCAYDVMSTQARKNPQGAVEAFKRAFAGNDSSVGLVIKINNAQQNLSETKNLRRALKGYSNCYIIEQTFDKTKMNSLLNLIDVFITLHRSEGFGLIPAEAMSLGKPVIMTRWSGNVDFMTADNSCGVDYKLVSIREQAGPYMPGNIWADPDLDHAAFFMRRLIHDNNYYKQISAQAKITIQENYSPDTVGKLIKERMRGIGLIQ